MRASLARRAASRRAVRLAVIELRSGWSVMEGSGKRHIAMAPSGKRRGAD